MRCVLLSLSLSMFLDAYTQILFDVQFMHNITIKFTIHYYYPFEISEYRYSKILQCYCMFFIQQSK